MKHTFATTSLSEDLKAGTVKNPPGKAGDSFAFVQELRGNFAEQFCSMESKIILSVPVGSLSFSLKNYIQSTFIYC